jgi:hypothetical protein
VPQPQVPGNLFAGEQSGGGQSAGNPAGEWAHATMLRGSAPAATEYGTRQDPTVQRPGLLSSPAGHGQAGPSRRSGAAEPAIDATVSRPAPVRETVPEAPTDHGKRNLWLAIAGGTLLVLAVIVGIVLASSAPAPKVAPTAEVSKPPADPLDNGTVPDVEGLSGTVATDGDAYFYWNNPQPKPGDKYKWRVYSIGGSGEYQAIDQAPVRMKPNPSGETCIQVMLVRSDGSFSPLEKDSIACARP